MDAVDFIVRVRRATVRVVPVLLFPSACVPHRVRCRLVRFHRHDTGRDTRRGLRATGERRRRDGRPVADERGAGLVPAAYNTVLVGRQFHVRRAGRHRGQRDGARGQRDVARGRFECDGMSRHQVRTATGTAAGTPGQVGLMA